MLEAVVIGIHIIASCALIGLVLVMAAFLLLGTNAASTGFADLRAAAAGLPADVRNTVFILALVVLGGALRDKTVEPAKQAVTPLASH